MSAEPPKVPQRSWTFLNHGELDLWLFIPQTLPTGSTLKLQTMLHSLRTCHLGLRGGRWPCTQLTEASSSLQHKWWVHQAPPRSDSLSILVPGAPKLKAESRKLSDQPDQPDEVYEVQSNEQPPSLTGQHPHLKGPHNNSTQAGKS